MQTPALICSLHTGGTQSEGQRVLHSDGTQASLRRTLSPGRHMHKEFQCNSCQLSVVGFRLAITDADASSLRIHLPSCPQGIVIELKCLVGTSISVSGREHPNAFF